MGVLRIMSKRSLSRWNVPMGATHFSEAASYAYVHHDAVGVCH